MTKQKYRQISINCTGVPSGQVIYCTVTGSSFIKKILDKLMYLQRSSIFGRNCRHRGKDELRRIIALKKFNTSVETRKI